VRDHCTRLLWDRRISFGGASSRKFVLHDGDQVLMPDLKCFYFTDSFPPRFHAGAPDSPRLGCGRSVYPGGIQTQVSTYWVDVWRGNNLTARLLHTDRRP
jgi:hypothetical protein